MSEDKLQLAREMLDEFMRTFRALDSFADDLVWDFSGFAGWIEDEEYHGKAGFEAQMERWLEPFESWSFEITELVDVGGDDVLGVGIQRGALKGSAAVVEMPLAQIWTLSEGEVKRMRIFATREDAYAAAGISPS